MDADHIAAGGRFARGRRSEPGGAWQAHGLEAGGASSPLDRSDALQHGKWRPRLATLVRENSEADVEAATTEAFTLLTTDEDAAKALDRLSKLRGVGPATASAILALWRPASEPFLSDELVLALGLPKPTYTAAEVKDVRRRVAEAVEANERWPELGGAEAFERACWAWAVETSARSAPKPKRTSTSGSTASAKRAKKT